MGSNQIKQELQDAFRQEIRTKIAQIEVLECLDALRDLEFIGVTVKSDAPLVASYQAIATDRCYPDVTTFLMGEGVLKRNQLIRDRTVNQGQTDEHQYVLFALDETREIQADLRVYNPNYDL